MALDYFATQAGSYSAETTRRAMFAAFARTAANSPGIISGGLLSSADLQITAPSSGMTVNIGIGEGIIGGSEGGAQGGYYFRNSSSFSAPVSAANPSNPRVDAVVATMADAGYTQPSDVGGTANGPVFAVVTGTPTAGATLSNLNGAPSIPLSTLLLGYVLVPAAATSIVTADILNVATSAALGADTVAFGPVAAQPPAASRAYQFYYATDTEVLYESNGSTWQAVMLAQPWTSLTLGSGVIAGAGFFPPSARLEGDIIRLKGTMEASGSSIGAGATWATVPTFAVPTLGFTSPAYALGSGIPASYLNIDNTGVITFDETAGRLALDGVTYSVS